MVIPVFVLALLFLLLGALATRSFILPLLCFPLYILIHFRRLFDYLIKLALRYRTYRLITDSHSEVYTADPINVECILKTNFPNYGKGEYNRGIMKDLFGEGIFAIDGKKWHHQRKLASYEFSAKVLRGFSCSVFRSNAAKLASKVYVEALANRDMDLQLRIQCSRWDLGLSSILYLDRMKSVTSLSKPLTDSNVIVYWRYVDVFWKVIDNFVYNLIHRKREQMRNEEGEKEDILSSFLIARKDTSANTLAWFFYMLCKHPLIQDKVLQDVKLGRKVCRRRRHSARWPQDKERRRHKLHAVCNGEKMLRNFAPRDGLKMVFFRVKVLFKFTAFQGGPRICLGKEFAYREMKIIVATVVMFLRFKLVEESRNATMFTLHMDKGLPLYAFPRLNINYFYFLPQSFFFTTQDL
ncbi:hypothetical protein SASPL_107583 [Salvia splendens]|uniref:Fatty acid omega-hydroxylase n=1 Tax=Salvia splendens TaxID=180675 RepID=A0A8X8YBF2_SALSN|nr:hypothetical protein SASPL_107583 [Salvia splendens]